MSHRTAPFYGGLRAALRIDRDASTAPLSIFSALEQGRFDAVRHAIEADPDMLTLRGGPTGVATPLEHALGLARLWNSLLVHCERTGAVVSPPGMLGARHRLAATGTMVEWLVTPPNAPNASPDALQAAIQCNYMCVAQQLVKRNPALAVTPGARDRSPLHVAMRLAARASPEDVLAYAKLLRKAGASFHTKNADGATPLHELVAALAVARRARSLERARVPRASLRTVQSTIEFAVQEGADLFAVDHTGITPLEAAIRERLDYLVFVRAADAVYRRICSRRRIPPVASMGMFDALPHDIMLRIISELSPRDAVCGIGATCVTLRTLVKTEFTWKRLSKRTCMARARSFLRKELHHQCETD